MHVTVSFYSPRVRRSPGATKCFAQEHIGLMRLLAPREMMMMMKSTSKEP